MEKFLPNMSKNGAQKYITMVQLITDSIKASDHLELMVVEQTLVKATIKVLISRNTSLAF